MLINSDQIKLLKTIIGKLKISDELYREMLANRYAVSSCKELTKDQAQEFITFLKNEANQSGLNFPKKSFQKHKYSNLEGREGMATPPQLRKIEAMWFEYSEEQDPKKRTQRLNLFLDKHFKITNLKFLPQAKCSKVIYCLQKMLDQKGKEAC